MPEVLLFTHHGIRCAVPSKRVMGAARDQTSAERSNLWNRPLGAYDDLGADRMLCLMTSSGPTWVVGSGMQVASVENAAILPLPALVRELVRYPHVVGLTIIGQEVVWLVDPLRFRPVLERGQPLAAAGADSRAPT